MMLIAIKVLLTRALYSPVIPWKQGERDAIATLPPALAPFVIPIFEVPPAGDFDHELGHILSPAEHLLHFGSRLFRCRGRLPAFIDASQIDDDRHRVDPVMHPLTALMERGRLSGAQAWPAATLQMSTEYELAVRRAVTHHGYPVALRISLSELESSNIAHSLREFGRRVGCERQDVMLVVDGRSLQIGDEAEFASLLVSKLNELPYLMDWGKLAFAATSLSDPQKMATRTEQTIPRKEWLVFKAISENPELRRLPLFSDYGVEFKNQLRPMKGIRPTAKMTYTTDKEYLCVKGESVRTGGYEAIYPVARTVAQSPNFLGKDYSEGSAHIELLAERKTSPGGAPKWRWATFNQHLACTLKGLLDLHGLELEAPADSVSQRQEDLFDTTSESK